jgi:hypothetical protein
MATQKDSIDELTSQVESMKELVREQMRANDVLRDEVESLKNQPVNTEADDNREAMKVARENMALQGSQGKYAYRVVHNSEVVAAVGGKREPRKWASHNYMPPFRCNEADPRKALRLYEEKTGMRCAPGQVQMELVKDKEPAESK